MENLNLCLTNSSKYQLGWRDEDGDGILDAADSTYNNWTDSDTDGVVDYVDNCPQRPNSNQSDADNDWIGDACDLPVITLISPGNMTYNMSLISLSFSVDKPTIWCAYSLDGGVNSTISGCSSTSLSVNIGSHSVVIFAKDTYDNEGSSDKVTFFAGGSSFGRPLLI